MRKWIFFLLAVLILAAPLPADAQGEMRIAVMQIKLWPEYDQPNMLVIYDFRLTDDVPLPARVTFSIPVGVTVIAVAAMEDGNLVNSGFEGPTTIGNWQEITILVEQPTTYHFEYYAPLLKMGNQRRYSFQWNGDYPLNNLDIRVQQPPSATNFKGTPALEASLETDNLTYHNLQVSDLQADAPFELVVEYQKNNDDLTVPDSIIQPSAPLNEDTEGRVALEGYIPYLIGGLGLVLIASGLGYYYLFARRTMSGEPHRRKRRLSVPESSSQAIYCSQCGERARGGDRFCRVCGTRLRQDG